jgi:hypothetical protein
MRLVRPHADDSCAVDRDVDVVAVVCINTVKQFAGVHDAPPGGLCRLPIQIYREVLAPLVFDVKRLEAAVR